MAIAYSVFADGLSQTPVFASPLDRGRFITNPVRTKTIHRKARQAFLIVLRHIRMDWTSMPETNIGKWRKLSKQRLFPRHYPTQHPHPYGDDINVRKPKNAGA